MLACVMETVIDAFSTLRPLVLSNGAQFMYFSLPALEEAGFARVSALPVSVRILLECMLRNNDGHRVTNEHVRALCRWTPGGPRTEEIPFIPARIILQDFTGVPLLVDLATMRDAVRRLGRNPEIVEPVVPVDLVIDHSVQVDFAGEAGALKANIEMELARNRERYQFLKWGMQAFKSFRVIPPAVGIIHQVNLEYLARGVCTGAITVDGQTIKVAYPDSVLGTDSHTTMINGLGILGWGVGGIEAEAGMLGQPTYLLMPEVVGVYLKGRLQPGVTATDLALTITQILRNQKVVGAFVEFHGPGAAALSVADRAVVANMAPEYGATMGYFPVDENCLEYLRQTGRSPETCELFEAYYKAQGLWGMPDPEHVRYSRTVEVDLGQIEPCVAGPKRPQDRVPLREVKSSFVELLTRPIANGGYGRPAEELAKTVPVRGSKPCEHHYSWLVGTRRAAVEPSESEMRDQHPAPDDIVIRKNNLNCQLRHGSIVLAAITSCTNTSNPTLILAAAILAKKAVERGMRVCETVKTSFAPGSRVVTEYLAKAGLLRYLEALGFHVVAYGCATCIGNSGPLEAHIEQAITDNDLVAVAVLSGNRNFEGRIHQAIRANYLMSPPLVVAFALAGRIDIDLTTEPVGFDNQGKPVFLRELWPSLEEINAYLPYALDPANYQQLYSDLAQLNTRWYEIGSSTGPTYAWDPVSTYIQMAPYFERFSLELAPLSDVIGARCLAIFGDSITTDHISPAGAIQKDSPAGKYLLAHNVPPHEFNSYGARRGNHQVMIRGTFANPRIRNLMLGGEEGGWTYYFGPPGHDLQQKMTIFDAAMKYMADGVPLVVLAGREYGTGSSRDWAAKGTALLGIRAVIAKSFERIHRANLVGMGVLPIELPEAVDLAQLGLDGSETYDIIGLEHVTPRQQLMIRIHHRDNHVTTIPATARIDTPVEVEYYRHGGILPYMLRKLIGHS